MKKFILCVLVVSALVLCLTACGSQNTAIQSVTNRFENSCNQLDLNAMLDCIDPDVSNGVKAVTEFIGMFSDKDSDELLDKFASVLFRDMPENSREFFSSISITLDSVELGEESNNAVATGTISYEISGENHEVDATLEYICIDEMWYISNLDLQ